MERRFGGRRPASAVEVWRAFGHRGFEGAIAGAARKRIARGEVLIRAERHREPRDELWLANARRSGGKRAESARQPGVRGETAGEPGENPFTPRHSVRPVAGLPDGGRGAEPRARRLDGREDRGRLSLAGGRDLLQPVYHAGLLGRPEQRRRVSNPGADSAAANELDGGGEEHSRGAAR